jgi:heme-degrading monooxygenase HmoA
MFLRMRLTLMCRLIYKLHAHIYELMILEAAILNVIPGKEAQFEKDFATAGQYISSIKGYTKHSLSKCIERQNQYLLLVEWETLEDHTVGFRQSAAYLEWKRLLHHYYDPFPVVEHYKAVV